MRTEPCRADSPSTTQNPTTFWPRRRTRCCRNIRCSTTPGKKPQSPNMPLEPEDSLFSLSSGKETRINCHFHRDYDHDIEEYYDLKNHIEDLIHQGHLDRYVRRLCEPSLHPKGLVEKQIDVIIGEPASRGDNSSARKAYA
ncbi:hypothetical protein B296_00039425 [Ensete ventricosum]|uniref:Uncharacterized protein n=1 Tax=Ensete ventricosum TaxID=4639 RepID=A0A426ZCG9_ENSVE|nr:hypothetical protein B296_00039425 [Ensete ventricosum]